MKTSKNLRLFNPISGTVLVILLSTVALLFYLQIINLPLTGFAVILSVLISSSIHIADQWEKAVVLRMGKFIGLRGPGPFMIIPIIDRVDNLIDQRIRVTDFKAEETLTKDTVPVNVDAVVYCTVWDVEKAALEVQQYIRAVGYIAQTGLREIIEKHELADLLQNREKIAESLQAALDEHTNPGV